jgi:hypothetical protein
MYGLAVRGSHKAREMTPMSGRLINILSRRGVLLMLQVPQKRCWW